MTRGDGSEATLDPGRGELWAAASGVASDSGVPAQHHRYVALSNSVRSSAATRGRLPPMGRDTIRDDATGRRAVAPRLGCDWEDVLEATGSICVAVAVAVAVAVVVDGATKFVPSAIAPCCCSAFTVAALLGRASMAAVIRFLTSKRGLCAVSSTTKR